MASEIITQQGALIILGQLVFIAEVFIVQFASWNADVEESRHLRSFERSPHLDRQAAVNWLGWQSPVEVAMVYFAFCIH